MASPSGESSGSPSRGPSGPSWRRTLLRSLAYGVLAVTCLLSAALLLGNGRYGLFAPLVQVLLAAIWGAIALSPWRRR